MEQLANDGNGSYHYVDDISEAQRIFVENLTGTLQTIARDSKVQVDFNPEVVSRYRLLGYENRRVDDQDFRNDTVDAGEVGAGHSVTALYELKLHDGASGNVGTVFVRYEDSDSGQIVETSQTLQRSDMLSRFDDASTSFQLAAVVAEYAELLRNSYWAQDGSLTPGSRRGAAVARPSSQRLRRGGVCRSRRPCPQGSRPSGTLDEVMPEAPYLKGLRHTYVDDNSGRVSHSLPKHDPVHIHRFSPD